MKTLKIPEQIWIFFPVLVAVFDVLQMHSQSLHGPEDFQINRHCSLLD